MIKRNQQIINAYAFGQVIAKIKLDHKSFLYALRDWEDNTFSVFEDIEKLEKEKPCPRSRGIYTVPFELMKNVIIGLEKLGPIKQNTLQFDHDFFKAAREMINDDGSSTIIFTHQNHPETIFDLLVRNSEPIGFVYCYYFDTIVFTTEQNLPYTPAREWFDSTLSKATRGYHFDHNDQVAMRDGIRLNTEIYLPADYQKGEKLPTILSRTPYDISTKVDIILPLAAFGYALVFQDCRGRGKSEGVFRPFMDEGDDGEDTLKYIEQQDWFDGHIGTFGGSYGGYYQWPLAFRKRKSLKCMIPFVTGGSLFEDAFRRGGSFQLKMIPWLMIYSLSDHFPDYDIFSPEDWEKYKDHRPLIDIPEKLTGKKDPFLHLMAENTTMSDFWTDQNFEQGVKDLDIPIMMISGPFDGDNTANERLWHYLEKFDIPGRKLIFGPWKHQINTTRQVGHFALDPNAAWYNLEIQLIRFYDRYLKNRTNGIGARSEVDYFIIGTGKWSKSRHFPDEHAQETIFYLDAAGSDILLSEKVPDASTASYIYDPKDAPPEIFMDGIPFGGADYSEIEKREDVLTFTTKPFKRDCAILGSVTIHLYVSSSAIDTDFAARLTLLRNGKSLCLTDNLLATRFRDGFEKAKPMHQETIYQLVFHLPMINFLVKKGEAIHLQICSGMKNLMVENPNTGDSIFTYTWDDVIPAEQTIHMGNSTPSHITLHILDED